MNDAGDSSAAPSPAPAQSDGDCVAFLRLDGTWECERCAKAWQEGDAAPACSVVTYARLRAAADEAAHRIEQNQRALLAAGHITQRDQVLLTLAMELRALVRMVDAVKDDAAVRAALARQARRPPRSSGPSTGYVRVGMKAKPQEAKQEATSDE